MKTTLDTKNLHKVAKKHGLSAADIKKKEKLIPTYLNRIEKRGQGFYDLPLDTDTPAIIKAFAKSVKGKYDDIVVLGIGGSALGTITLRDSLTHLFTQQYSQSKKHPRLHVLDNIDPVLIQELEDIIKMSKTLFIVISKSGTTPETMAQYKYFKKRGAKHFAFITDPEKGELREIAEKENRNNKGNTKDSPKIPIFDIPQNVGGRFSVLTPVGLLPAALIGIDIDKLLKGAASAHKNFFATSASNNPAFTLATIQHQLYKKHKYITVLTPYAQKLATFGQWYAQLLAESIGKKRENRDNRSSDDDAHVGITPVNALGATDQHSQLQLWSDGPNDKLIIFLEVAKLAASSRTAKLATSALTTSSRTAKLATTPHTTNRDTQLFTKLISIEKNATATALTKHDRPNITVNIPQITEETLGELFMTFEGSIAFLGEYFNINAFDQPGVELSKTLTKQALKRQKIAI